MSLVAVTGASGFIGKALCQALLERGVRVRAIVRQGPRAAGLHRTLGARRGLDIAVITDLVDPIPPEVLAGATAVVHLAARVHSRSLLGGSGRREFERVNVAGTEALARAASRAGVGVFIFLSSIAVNGAVTNGRPFSEADEARPVTVYGYSKLLAEKAIRTVAQETGLRFVTLRAPLVYGPEAPGNFATLIRVVKTGMPLPFAGVRNRRSLLGIDNLLSAIECCIALPSAANETFLVSDGEDVSTPDLLARLSRELESATTLVRCPSPAIRAVVRIGLGRSAMVGLCESLEIDSRKIRSTLGWQPPRTVDEGLGQAARWFRESGKRYRVDRCD